MAQGFTVSTGSLAIRIGELRSLASAVERAAFTLSTTGGDLGPGEITAAVQEVSARWYDGLGEMRDKIDTMADNVANAVDNYETIERGGEERMTALASGIVFQRQIAPLRRDAAALRANDRALDQAAGD